LSKSEYQFPLEVIETSPPVYSGGDAQISRIVLLCQSAAWF